MLWGLLLLRRLAGLHGKRLHLFEFFLKPRDKIVRAVLEEYDEAECKKQKQNEPEKAAKQGHGGDGILVVYKGQCGVKLHTNPLM